MATRRKIEALMTIPGGSQGRTKFTLSLDAEGYQAAKACARAKGFKLSRILDALLADFVAEQGKAKEEDTSKE